MRFAADIRKRLLLLSTAVFLLNAASAWGDCCDAIAGEPEAATVTAGMPCDHGGGADAPHEHESDCCMSCVVAQVTSLGKTRIVTGDPVALLGPLPLRVRPGVDPPYRPPNLLLS